MFIYVIVCSESLKLYVGQHKGDDLNHYLDQKWWAAHSTQKTARSHLYNAMRKHPRESWSIHPLVSGIESREELDELEKHFIRVLNCQHPEVGYNICEGGEGFSGPHSEATKKKCGIAAQTRWSDPKAHEDQRNRSKMHWQDPAFREKTIAALQNTECPTRFQVGQTSWCRGTKGVMKPNRTSFYKGQPRNPKAGPKGPNRTSFVKGQVPQNAGRPLPAEWRAKLKAVHGVNGSCKCKNHVAARVKD